MTRGLHAETNVQRGAPGDATRPWCGAAHERQEPPPIGVVLALAGFLSLIGFGIGAAALAAHGWARRHPPPPAVRPFAPPRPRLLADPRAERLMIEARARRSLQSGGMPIDRAMATVAREGWDAK